jgi:hypothetical protein
MIYFYVVAWCSCVVSVVLSFVSICVLLPAPAYVVNSCMWTFESVKIVAMRTEYVVCERKTCLSYPEDGSNRFLRNVD